MTQLNFYLVFPGTYRQAMEFYKAIFDAELHLQTFEKMPSMVKPDLCISNRYET